VRDAASSAAARKALVSAELAPEELSLALFGRERA
jgi:hypothetical protein